MMNFEFKDYDTVIKIYSYDDDGVFIGERDYTVPAGTGLPALCTLQRPPEAKAGFAIVFKDEAWSYQEDNRGRAVWDTLTSQKIMITRPGALPENVTPLEPASPADRFENGAWTPSEEVARQIKRDEIESWRATQEYTRQQVSHNGHDWDCDKISLERLQITVSQANKGSIPAGFFWTDFYNQAVTLNAQQLIALYEALLQHAFLHGSAIHKRQRQMKDELNTITGVQQIMNYTVGWGTSEESI